MMSQIQRKNADVLLFFTIKMRDIKMYKVVEHKVNNIPTLFKDPLVPWES